jgi:hypothetical protein
MNIRALGSMVLEEPQHGRIDIIALVESPVEPYYSMSNISMDLN